jgi:hypothetical protein
MKNYFFESPLRDEFKLKWPGSISKLVVSESYSSRPCILVFDAIDEKQLRWLSSPADMSPARKINVSIRENDSFDFTWSFYPIFFWMRAVLGIELNDNKLLLRTGDTTPFRRRCCQWIGRFFLGFFVLVISLSINILDAIFTYDDTMDSHYLLHEEKVNVTTSDLMIIRIAAVNEVFYNGTIHLIFYSLACREEWKELWATLQKIQFQLPKLDREFYFTCRKIAVFGVICIFVVMSVCVINILESLVLKSVSRINFDYFLPKNCGLNVRLAINHLRTTESIDKVTLVTSLSKLSETLSLSILVFFFVLVWSNIYLFRFANLKTSGLLEATSSSSAPCFTISQQLENWRRFHVFVCQLVDRINSCFGFILLVAMTHGFISFISDSFEITMAFSNNETFQTRFLIRFCQHFALLFVVCYSSYRLQSEVKITLSTNIRIVITLITVK